MLRFLKDFLNGTPCFYCPHCDRFYRQNKVENICKHCNGETILLQPNIDYDPEIVTKAYTSPEGDTLSRFSEITSKLKEKYYIGDRQGWGDTTRKELYTKSSPPLESIQSVSIKCPNCKSSAVEKIGAIERGASVAFLGIASGKIGKNFKCKSCGNIW